MAFMVAFHGCLRNMECTGKSPDPLNFFYYKGAWDGDNKERKNEEGEGGGMKKE